MPGIAATGSSAAAVQPEPSSGAAEEANDAGAAACQLAGTDRPPTADASPRLADAAAPKPPAGMNEPTMVPGNMAALTGAGATQAERAQGTDPTAPTVCPNDTAVGMVFITNQAAVFTVPLMVFATNGVPRKPSND